jgi:hypothetical protein
LSGKHTLLYRDGDAEDVTLEEHAFFLVDIEDAIKVDLPAEHHAVKDELLAFLSRSGMPPTLFVDGIACNSNLVFLVSHSVLLLHEQVSLFR